MKLILLSYINRSGSTYLINYLSKIPGICVCPEADILFSLFLKFPGFKIKKYHLRKWIRILDSDEKFKAWKISASSLITSEMVGRTTQELFFRILLSFRDSHLPSYHTIVFKNNHLYRVEDKLMESETFEIYHVFLIRDPRAVYCSQKFTINPITNRAMSRNPLQVAIEWRGYMRSAQRKIISNPKCKIIKFEDYVSEFNNTIKDLLFFIHGSDAKYTDKLTESTLIPFIDEKHILIHSIIEEPIKIGKINEWKDKLLAKEIKTLEIVTGRNILYSIKIHGFFEKLKRPGYIIQLSFQGMINKCINSIREIYFYHRAY